MDVTGEARYSSQQPYLSPQQISAPIVIHMSELSLMSQPLETSILTAAPGDSLHMEK